MNPAQFECDKSSPTAAAVWSNTQPPVALTHIFCGQINEKRKAEGFHSHPNNKDPVCARANNKILADTTLPLSCYGKLEVRQLLNGFSNWIARNPSTYCFFPSGRDIVETVNVLVGIYNQCQNKRDSDKICYKNYSHPDKPGAFGIVISLQVSMGKMQLIQLFLFLKIRLCPCPARTSALAPRQCIHSSACEVQNLNSDKHSCRICISYQ